MTLALLSAVTIKMVPCLIFSASTITTGIAACASLDFPQPIYNRPRLPEDYTLFTYLKTITTIVIIIKLSTKNMSL